MNFDIDAWTEKVRSGPNPKVIAPEPHPQEYPDHDDDEDFYGERELDDCPRCGGTGQYDDVMPCSFCDGHGIAPWDW